MFCKLIVRNATLDTSASRCNIPVVEVTHPYGDMIVICNISQGGLGPLLQAVGEGGVATIREGAFGAAYAACLITPHPAGCMHLSGVVYKQFGCAQLGRSCRKQHRTVTHVVLEL